MLEVVLAPHNDDECLFVAFTVMRNRPLVIVITDGYRQGIDPEIRRKESIEAMKVLNAPVVFWGIRDMDLTEKILTDRIKDLRADIVYAPAVQHGHKDHDTVGIVARKLFGERLRQYSTYSKTNWFVEEGRVVEPTKKEIEIKNKALKKYATQRRIFAKVNFEAVIGRPEYFL